MLEKGLTPPTLSETRFHSLTRIPRLSFCVLQMVRRNVLINGAILLQSCSLKALFTTADNLEIGYNPAASLRLY